MSNESKYEERRLEDLKPHPLQEHFYTGLNEHQLDELAADIERNGLREAIEILPENEAGLPPDTILSGHQRRLALLKLGYERIDAYIRYDLAGATAEEIERNLIEANQNRQHLSKLQQARIALRRYEIEQNRAPGELYEWEEDEARDRVGNQIGMSGRNLQRYFRVLQTPIEVQQAFDRKNLTLILASRVAGLSPETQQEIAFRIDGGETPREVVEDFLERKDGSKPIDQVVRQFEKSLGRSLDEIEPRLKDIRTAPPDGFLRQLDRAATFIHKLSQRCRKNQERQQQKINELMEEFE